jgi:hypothetical protein
MATEYMTRPSDLMGVEDDPYTAYCLDDATRLWGRWVERQLDEAEQQAPSPSMKKSARVSRFNTIMLDPKDTQTPGKSGFRDPAAFVSRGGDK